MGFREKIFYFYFNYVYNPVYDLTVGQFTAYRSLQKKCVNKFQFGDRDRVLCVGIGTGNEINYFPDGGTRKIGVVGVDISERALMQAHQKGSKLGMDFRLFTMDAQSLDFPTESFDKALCIHVMDFVGNVEDATKEILRVLRKEGQYVITYPAEMEGAQLGLNLLREGLRQNLKSGKFGRAILELVAAVAVSFVYIPFLFRPNQRAYAELELKEMLCKLGVGDFQIEQDRIYLDAIVSGRK